MFELVTTVAVGNCRELQILNIAHNDLAALPMELSKCSNLRHVYYIGGNCFGEQWTELLEGGVPSLLHLLKTKLDATSEK